MSQIVAALLQPESSLTSQRALFGVRNGRDRFDIDFLRHTFLGDVVIAHPVLRGIVPRRKKSRDPVNVRRFRGKTFPALESNDLADGETVDGHGTLLLSGHLCCMALLSWRSGANVVYREMHVRQDGGDAACRTSWPDYRRSDRGLPVHPWSAPHSVQIMPI